MSQNIRANKTIRSRRSETEISGYIEGREMGFAKAAELNGYPGPAHVLELADELVLTPKQRARAQALKDSMKNAASLGAQLVDTERRLDTLFAQGEATDQRITWLVEKIGQLQAEIRLVRLRAHLLMRDVLTADKSANTNRLAVTPCIEANCPTLLKDTAVEAGEISEYKHNCDRMMDR